MIRRYKPRGSYEKIVAREPHNAKSFLLRYFKQMSKNLSLLIKFKAYPEILRVFVKSGWSHCAPSCQAK